MNPTTTTNSSLQQPSSSSAFAYGPPLPQRTPRGTSSNRRMQPTGAGYDQPQQQQQSNNSNNNRNNRQQQSNPSNQVNVSSLGQTFDSNSRGSSDQSFRGNFQQNFRGNSGQNSRGNGQNFRGGNRRARRAANFQQGNSNANLNFPLAGQQQQAVGPSNNNRNARRSRSRTRGVSNENFQQQQQSPAQNMFVPQVGQNQNQNVQQQPQQQLPTKSAMRRAKKQRALERSGENQNIQQASNSQMRVQFSSDVPELGDLNPAPDLNENMDVESGSKEPVLSRLNNNKRWLEKSRPYLRSDHIRNWLKKQQDDDRNIHFAALDQYNVNFCIKAAPVLDQLARDRMEIQVLDVCLSLIDGDPSFIPKEISELSRSRDTNVNRQLCVSRKTKAGKSVDNMSQLFGQFQSELAAYLPAISPTEQPVVRNQPAPSPRSILQDRHKYTRDIAISYIAQFTDYVKKGAILRVDLARAEGSERIAYGKFKEKSTSAQNSVFLVLAPKLDALHLKNVKFQEASKHLEFKLVPSFIPSPKFALNLDESALTPQQLTEARADAEKLTVVFQQEAMKLFLRTLTQEIDHVKTEINSLLAAMPNDIDGTPGHALFDAFMRAREIREEFEVKKTVHFLEEKREIERLLAIDFSIDPTPVLFSAFTLPNL